MTSRKEGSPSPSQLEADRSIEVLGQVDADGYVPIPIDGEIESDYDFRKELFDEIRGLGDRDRQVREVQKIGRQK